MKKNVKIIYASLAAVVIIALVLAVVLTRNSSEPEDVISEAVTPDEEPEDNGELEIILDTLNVPQNTLTIPSMQILPLLAEWGELTWVSEDTEIAEVSEDGLILSKAVGETMLIGTSEDGLLTANLPVYVEELIEDEEEEPADPPEGLSMDITDLNAGEALMDAFFAYYEGSPEIGDEVVDESLEEASDLDDDVVTLADLSAALTWTSTAPEIADVSETGIVTFMDSGVVAVTAEDEDGNE